MSHWQSLPGATSICPSLSLWLSIFTFFLVVRTPIVLFMPLLERIVDDLPLPTGLWLPLPYSLTTGQDSGRNSHKQFPQMGMGACAEPQMAIMGQQEWSQASFCSPRQAEQRQLWDTGHLLLSSGYQLGFLNCKQQINTKYVKFENRDLLKG